MYIQQVISQKYPSKLGVAGGGRTKSQNFGIEGQKKLWKNQFDRLSKMPLVQVWCNSPYSIFMAEKNNWLIGLV